MDDLYSPLKRSWAWEVLQSWWRRQTPSLPQRSWSHSRTLGLVRTPLPYHLLIEPLGQVLLVCCHLQTPTWSLSVCWTTNSQTRVCWTLLWLKLKRTWQMKIARRWSKVKKWRRWLLVIHIRVKIMSLGSGRIWRSLRLFKEKLEEGEAFSVLSVERWWPGRSTGQWLTLKPNTSGSCSPTLVMSARRPSRQRQFWRITSSGSTRPRHCEKISWSWLLFGGEVIVVYVVI